MNDMDKRKVAVKLLTKLERVMRVPAFQSRAWEARKKAKIEKVLRREELQKLHSQRRKMAL